MIAVYGTGYLPRHQALAPPSTGILAPVMNPARSEARNTATSTISSGFPQRLSSVLLANASRVALSSPRSRSAPGVRIGPGLIAMTRIPYGAPSRASYRVMPMTPAFAAACAVIGGIGCARMPAVEAMLMTTPPPAPPNVAKHIS